MTRQCRYTLFPKCVVTLTLPLGSSKNGNGSCVVVSSPSSISFSSGVSVNGDENSCQKFFGYESNGSALKSGREMEAWVKIVRILHYIPAKYLPPSRGFTTVATTMEFGDFFCSIGKKRREKKRRDFSIWNIRNRHNQTQNEADKMWIMRK